MKKAQESCCQQFYFLETLDQLSIRNKKKRRKTFEEEKKETRQKMHLTSVRFSLYTTHICVMMWCTQSQTLKNIIITKYIYRINEREREREMHFEMVGNSR